MIRTPMAAPGGSSFDSATGCQNFRSSVPIGVPGADSVSSRKSSIWGCRRRVGVAMFGESIRWGAIGEWVICCFLGSAVQCLEPCYKAIQHFVLGGEVLL